MAKQGQKEIGGLFEGGVKTTPSPILVTSRSTQGVSNQRVTVRLGGGATDEAATAVQTIIRYSRRIVFSRKS